MILITDLIKSVTFIILDTDIRNAEAILALLSLKTVGVLQTLAPVVSHVTDGGGVRTVGVHVTTCKARIELDIDDELSVTFTAP